MVGHDCDAPVEVEVGGTKIPVIDDGVTVHERKGGPLDISRRAEVTFPLSDGETEWVNHIKAFTSGGTMEKASVKMTPLDINGNFSADEVTLLNGYVAGVGAQEKQNQGHITILGPYNLINEIPAGVSFKNIDTANDVIRWVTDEFESEQPIFDQVNYATNLSAEELGPPSRHRVTRLKRFTPNRNTLKDVLDWLADIVDARIWFEPREGGGVALRAINSPGRNYDATSDDSEVVIINNDALFEMKPGNTLQLRGEADHAVVLEPFGEIDTHIGSGSYAEAEAWYPPLVARAGGKITQVSTSTKNRESSVEAEARNRLKKTLDDVSGGTMNVALAPQLTPFDVVTAYPGCKGVLDKDLPALDYEVERTAHTLAPKPNNEQDRNSVPQTEIAVSMNIDPAKIKSRSTTKRITPMDSEEQDDEPFDPSNLPWIGISWGISSWLEN